MVAFGALGMPRRRLVFAERLVLKKQCGHGSGCAIGFILRRWSGIWLQDDVGNNGGDRPMLKIILGAALALVAGLGALLVGRTLLLPGGVPSPTPVTAAAPELVDGAAAAARLGEAIRLGTISWGDREIDHQAFDDFAAFLERAYPAAHRAMTRETIGGHSLLYRWKGSADVAPVGFIAHIDVVPVEPGTESGWTHGAFDGVVEGGALWGRGAMDNKGQIG